MKTHIIPAIILTLICLVVFPGAYTLLIWGTGQLLAPGKGKGETINYTTADDTKAYGYSNIGQRFDADTCFWSRPSAVGYNAAGSGAGNKGPSNEEYLALVQARIDTFMVHNPGIKKSDIPVEMVTSSGSGLDPHLSPKAAFIQIPRIARIRKLPETKLKALVNDHIEEPLFGLFGPAQVNVLKLNIALNYLDKKIGE